MLFASALDKKVLALFLLLLVATTTVTAEGSSNHLKEILLGRCYYDPPFSAKSQLDAQSCPHVVDTFVNMLTSHADATIQADDFEEFMQQVDFSFPAAAAPDSEEQKPMIWLKFLGQDTPQFPLPPNFVTPETTPGGKLMHDLIFCGANQNQCNVETSRAYWKFWQAAYYKFSKSLHYASQGLLTIVVEPYADVQFLERSIVPVLVGNMISSAEEAITSVIIYETEGNCEADTVQKLMHVLQVQNMGSVECRKTIWELWDIKEEGKVNQQTNKEEEDQETPLVASHQPIPTTTQLETCWLLLTYMGLLIVFYYCATEVITKAREQAAADGMRNDYRPPVGEDFPLLWETNKIIYHKQQEDDDDTVSGSTIASVVVDTTTNGSNSGPSTTTMEHFQIQ